MRILATFLSFGLVAAAALIALSQSQPHQRQEIIKFSHKYHQTEIETTCGDCHTQAVASTRAADNLLPQKSDCAECHDVEEEDDCSICHFEAENTRRAFKPVARELLFGHKKHVERLDGKCETCHQNLNEVDFSDSNSMPDMAVCSTCHDNQQATLECQICHSNTLNLRPSDHTADFLVSHKNIARFDQETCASCHSDNDCAECHDGAALFATESGGNMQSRSPFFPAIGPGTRSLTISRVHELNFRATHPLQAQGRTSDCAVCHETRSFCQDCHESSGVVVAGKPIWHGGPDWGALAGVTGTGGGRHAALAKRDMESCAACHSNEGNDPTCLLCHTDFDGVRGTNPRTHERGFANRFGEGSDFHEDESALCFSCHTDSMQRGVGFCGYCHGP